MNDTTGIFQTAPRAAVANGNCWACGDRILIGESIVRRTLRNGQRVSIGADCADMTDEDITSADAAWCEANGVRR
jgi:hypothetical protein